MEYQMDVWERPHHVPRRPPWLHLVDEPNLRVNSNSSMSIRIESAAASHTPQKPMSFGDSSHEDLDEPSRQPLFSDGPHWHPPPPPPTFPVSRRDENHRRGNYGFKLEFIFACIAFGFNVETVWKLPYLCVKYGGVVFMGGYFIAMFLIAFPMLVLEMSLGQFHSAGYLSSWNMCPLAKGIAFGVLLIVVISCVYEHLFTTYHLIYMFFSVVFWGDIQWIGCGHWWNTKMCRDTFSFDYFNSSLPRPYRNYDNTSSVSPSVLIGIPATQEFFENYVLVKSDNITEFGSLQPPLVFAMLAAWGEVIFLTFLGAKETGKLSYIMMPTPVLLLLPLIFRGALLPGALEGIISCLTPDIYKAMEFEFWQEAFHIAIWTFLAGGGVILSVASHNKFRNNCIVDAFVVTFFTIIFHVAAVLCFSTYFGYLALMGNRSFKDVVTQGVEFSFVTMPDAIASLPGAPIWSLVFFGFMFNMGLCRSAYYVQAISVSLMDAFRLPHSWVFTILFFIPISVICFLLGLPLTSEAGIYIASALEEYTFKIPFFIALFSLPVLVIWVYGLIPKVRILKFPQEIRSMTGCFNVCVQVLFMVIWSIFIPLITGFWTLFYVGYLSIDSIEVWLALVFILIGIVPIILFCIIVIIYQLCQFRNSHSYFTEMFWKAAQPSVDWGPATDKHRLELCYRTATDEIPRTEPHQRRPLQTNRFAAAAATPPSSQAPYNRNQPSPVGTYQPSPVGTYQSGRAIGPHPAYQSTPGSMATYPSNAPTPSKMAAQQDASDNMYDTSERMYDTTERSRSRYDTAERLTYATTDRATYASTDRATYATTERPNRYATTERATYATTERPPTYATNERPPTYASGTSERDRSMYSSDRNIYSSDRHMYSSDTQVPNYDEIMIQPGPHNTSTLTYSSHETQL